MYGTTQHVYSARGSEIYLTRTRHGQLDLEYAERVLHNCLLELRVRAPGASRLAPAKRGGPSILRVQDINRAAGGGE